MSPSTSAPVTTPQWMNVGTTPADPSRHIRYHGVDQQTGKEFPLESENRPIERDGAVDPHLSRTFDVFDWELADGDVDVRLNHALVGSGIRVLAP